jgi:large subunit ribosomal protein L17
MRRGKSRKFGKVRKTRKALYKALATALIEHGKIQTTVAKAKSISTFTDKMVTKAKKGDVASGRLIRHYLGDKATKKLMTEIGPKFKERNGGYTKVLKMGRRLSDGAEMALIEFTK